MQAWRNPPQKVKQAIVTLADGLNQSAESIEIKDSQNTSVVNMDSSLYPTVQVRDGYTQFAAHTGYINRIFKFLGDWYCGNGRGLYKQSGSSWTAVYEYSDTNNNRMWDAAMFFDGSKLYFIDGSLQLRQYNGSSLTTLGAARPNSSFIATYMNRFFMAGSNDNLLWYSGLRDAADWTSTNKYTGTGKITVETQDGEKPSGLTGFNNHVILFKKYTMHKLFGEDSTNFNMTQPFGVGCISDRTIVPTRDSLFWLAADGFYDYMGGAAPTKISDPVKNYINSINIAYAQHCVAGTDGRFVYLSLVTGSATTPNVTLKYDLQTGGWWVESYVATAFHLDGTTLYFATSDGRIMRMGGVSDNGEPIPWNIITKPFSEGDETVRKTINRLWIVADIEPDSAFNVYYAGGTEDGTWINVHSQTNGTGQIQSMKIPVIVRTPETWYRLRMSGVGKVKIHRIIREVTRRGA